MPQNNDNQNYREWSAWQVETAKREFGQQNPEFLYRSRMLKMNIPAFEFGGTDYASRQFMVFLRKRFPVN